jgi:hypothetical protein
MTSWLWYDRAAALEHAASLFAWTIACEAVLAICCAILVIDVIRRRGR